MQSIRKVHISNEDLEKILMFLTNLIMKSGDELVKHVIFFPFLIRSEGSIIEKKSVNDFSNFKLSHIEKDNVKNILLVLQKNLNDFSQEIYKEALQAS